MCMADPQRFNSCVWNSEFCCQLFGLRCDFGGWLSGDGKVGECGCCFKQTTMRHDDDDVNDRLMNESKSGDGILQTA